jgi:transcriptional regulator with XRE-family HTH domain
MADASMQQKFGEIIREARESLAISQEALADTAGLHRTYISLLERGLRNPSLSVILCLADALNLQASELLARFEAAQTKRGRANGRKADS